MQSRPGIFITAVFPAHYARQALFTRAVNSGRYRYRRCPVHHAARHDGHGRGHGNREEYGDHSYSTDIPLIYSIDKLITETRRLAAEYRRSTGQVLPVSGEIARHDAARLLGLTLCEPGTAGVDAIGTGTRDGQRIQIKARLMTQDHKPGARLGQLNMNGEWNTLMLVILDEDYESCEIYEASREELADAIAEATGSNRAKRGALSIARFKNLGWLVWTRETGIEPGR